MAKLASLGSIERELFYRPNITGWTPQRVDRARQMADGGALLELADLCETLFTDDRIQGVLSTRTHGLLGLPVDFVRGDPRARKALSAREDGSPGEWWSMHDESELVKLLSWGLTLGVGLAQRIELPRQIGKPHRYRIETWSPRWLTYFFQPVNGCHWHVQTQDGFKPIAAGDGEWILFTPYGVRRPWAEGLWRALSFPWLLKRYSLEDRANYSEVLGSPIWVGTTTAGATEKQRNKYLSQLRSLGKAGKVVLPAGWDMQLREATGKSYEIYEGQIAWADSAMTISLAGQVVTTEGMSGFSSGDIHDAIKQDLIRFDAERLSTALRQQSLEPWSAKNFGASSKAPWPQWRTQRPTDQSEEADGLSKLGDAITKLDAALSGHNLMIDAAKLVADFDIPVLNKPPPDTLRKRAPKK